MTWKEKQKKEGISEEEWKIVEERLKTMPQNLHLGILSMNFTRDELIIQIQEKTEVGQAYVEMQMEFIKWLAKQSNIIPSS